jgi:hypothetical protein
MYDELLLPEPGVHAVECNRVLEVLVVERVPQEVTHLGGLGDGAGDLRLVALRGRPVQRPVRGLHGARVGVGASV